MFWVPCFAFGGIGLFRAGVFFWTRLDPRETTRYPPATNTEVQKGQLTKRKVVFLQGFVHKPMLAGGRVPIQEGACFGTRDAMFARGDPLLGA